MPPPRSERRLDLDWLRIFACYLLLLFHVAMVFNPAPFYHVRNGEVGFAFLVLCGFISLWHMPLFFLLAGWSAAASLRGRGVSGFLRERVLKLGVPLLAGCALLAPGIKYVELRSGLDLNHAGLRVAAELQESFRPVVPSGLPLAEPFDEGFLTFLPTFFTRLDRFSWSHLWFLAYLLTFSLLYLPLFVGLLRSRWEAHHVNRAWAYAPLLPLVAIQLGLREHWPGPYNLYADWANVSYFSVFLLAGFLFARLPSLERAVHQEWRRALALALAAMGGLLALVLGAGGGPTALGVGAAVAGWCFVVALLGFARERLAAHTRGLAYLADSAFPIYLLHQSVVVFLAWGVVTLPLGMLAKFALLLAASTAGTLALYHFGVRPFGPARRLAGLKPPAGSEDRGGGARASGQPGRSWRSISA